MDTYDTLDGVRDVVALARELGAGFLVRAVRLDSGDLLELSRGARRILDDAGLPHVGIFASGVRYPVEVSANLAAWRDRIAVGTMGLSVAHGVVTLDGIVPSLAHKRLAGVLAWWVPGVRDVVNGLEVVPPEEDSDDEVSDAVRLVLEKIRSSTRASSASRATRRW